jgi:hypothetical protein
MPVTSTRKELKPMSEAKMRLDAIAGVAAPPFHPILTDAGGGLIFTMLGTTVRLIATAAGTGGRYTVIEQVTPPGWVHRDTSIRVRTR